MVTGILPLTIEHATVRRRGRRLIGPISHVLSPEGLTIVMGPNGAGKTSLLRMMHGVVRHSEGQVSWAQPQEIAEKKQAFVFQSPIMLRRSVLKNLTYPLELIKAPNAPDRASEWAARIGLEDKLELPAPRLSGGEKQKLTLARALIRGPEVLFLDEPCANLDGSATKDIEAILHEATQAGTRIVMSTHDMGQARRLATDVIFMLGGKIHEKGTAQSIFSAPERIETKRFLSGEIVE
ncbi:ATP-binding cassette domain-containing protein [Falsihalocynthiibacter sp. SS001]|uniref:ABC transporter ATP-binding protein n=1 Tax=Falsihalocynthiibacter sp. SS001 TaxID=3349698 RepID=UPI0036D260A0